MERIAPPPSELVVATRNPGKAEEIRRILKPLKASVRTLTDDDGIGDIVEDGETYLENASKKAITVANATGKVALGDDSGLEVDALAGAPGVFSARFSGVEGAGATAANNAKLAEALAEQPDDRRSARFRCVMALAVPGRGVVASAEGVCEGIIGRQPRGDAGFGYDPWFVLPEHGQTFAELESDQKDAMSHRGRALRAIEPALRAALGEA